MSIIAELRDRTSHGGIPLIHTGSESILVSNVFGVIKNLRQEIILRELFKKILKIDTNDEVFTKVQYDFWKKFPVPKGIKEGSTEVDIVIELKDLIIFIEAKYLSEESKGTTHEPDRDQLIRNLDIANIYSKKNNKDFYVIYLTCDEFEPEIISKIRRGNISSILSSETEINDIKGKIYWASFKDFSDILSDLLLNNKLFKTEENFTRDLLDYLCKKGIAKNNLCSFNNKQIKEDYYKICRKECNGFRSMDKWNNYKDESWRGEVWEEKDLIRLLNGLNYKQKRLLYFLASKGGGAYQREIMKSLDFLNGKDSGTLRGIKAGINKYCKNLNKMPLLSIGTGSGENRYHEINRELGVLRESIIDYIKKNFNF